MNAPNNSPRTFFRGGPSSNTPSAATAADVIAYEQNQLGNADVVAVARTVFALVFGLTRLAKATSR